MKLLVSVRDAREAGAALRGGADVIDVKDPDEGALGAPAPAVLRQVVAVVDGRRPVSVALGDLPDLPHSAALAAVGAAAAGADIVKVGLAAIGSLERAIAMMAALREAVAPDCAVIAAAYADAATLSPAALGPRMLPELVARSGISGALVDTALKDGRGLYAHLEPEALVDLIARTRSAGGTFAVAGQLRRSELTRVDADLVGVRSAVCRDADRTRELQTELVAAAVAAVRAAG